MKKIIKIFFDYNQKRFIKNSELPALFSQIHNEINIQVNNKPNYPIQIETFNNLFENILIKHIKTRCEDLSLTNTVFKDAEKTYIKLYGDSNFIYDDSNFIVIKNSDKLNENLQINTDLVLTDADIYFIISENLNFLEIDNSLFYKQILAIIHKSQLKTLKDLKSLTRQIIGDNIIRKI